MANAIYRALESGRLTEERINRSYERIIEAKERMGLLCRQEIHPEKAMAEALNPENVAFTRALAQDAQAVLQGTLNLTPDETLLVVAPTQRPTTGAEDMKPLSFADEVEKAWGTRGVGTMDFSPSVTEEEMAAVCAQVEEKVSQGCSQVLLGLFNCRFRRIHLQLLRDLEQKAREGKVKLTVALLGAPYDLNLIEGDETVVTCFEYTPLSVSGLIYALEQNRFPGKNPYGRMK